MDTHSQNANLRKTEDHLEEKGAKKSYLTPHLVEYGSFTKLTGSGAMAGADGGGMSNFCL
jgi:hypothetical protein